MQKQLTHYEFKQMQKSNKNDIIFVLDNLEHDENIGSAFRIADAFNITKIIIITLIIIVTKRKCLISLRKNIKLREFLL